MNDDHISTGTALAKMAPALGGAAYAGLTLNEWAALATLIYVLLQIGLLLPKYWAWARRRFWPSGEQ